MIVKFLRPAASFKGVGYSFAKMLLDKGELMRVKNFTALEGLINPRAQDYVNYLEAITGRSKRIVYPQLHVAISTKSRDHSKEELTVIAEKWMNGMGYGNHPYLIIFHNDTHNNHVHLVSTRIGRDGKKVKDSYEKIKAYEVLNQIMGLDESQQLKKDVSKAFSYNISSRAQFFMLLEVQGYKLSTEAKHCQIFKFGKQLDTLPMGKIDERIANYRLNKERLQQLRAIIEKYRQTCDSSIYAEKSMQPGGGEGKITGYNSPLADMLHRQFGLQIFFHAKNGKPPYGYTIIDHAQKAVYKGGEVMPLAEFIKQGNAETTRRPDTKHILDGPEYFESYVQEPQWSLTGEDVEFQAESFEHAGSFTDYTMSPGIYVPPLRLDIADDIDDEQINGRNRRRKRKARTNSR